MKNKNKLIYSSIKQQNIINNAFDIYEALNNIYKYLELDLCKIPCSIRIQIEKVLTKINNINS